MSFYSRNRTQSRKVEEAKIIGDRLYYEMFFKKGMKILDIGCSTGTFALNDPKNITGIDADKDAIPVAKSKGINCMHFNADNKKLPFKSNTFDAVNLKSVLAHISNALLLLKEIRRVLKPNGKLVAFTANIKILKFDFFEDYTHVSPFTKNSLKNILYDAGFRNYEAYNFPMRMFGMGLLYRNKILSAKRIHSIEKFALNFPVTLKLFSLFDNRVNLIAECYK